MFWPTQRAGRRLLLPQYNRIKGVSTSLSLVQDVVVSRQTEDRPHPIGGVDYPRTPQEFDEWFPSEAACGAYLERWLLGTHQGAVSNRHLDYYLDEYTFRLNRRTSKARGLLFYRLIQHAVQVAPVPYNHLVGGTDRPHHKM